MNWDSTQLAGSANDGERRLVNAAWAQFERIGLRGATAPSATAQPLQVPGYRMLGEIHRGGQGVVYQAIQESTQRKLAIKVLKEGPFADRVELARFEREIDVLSRLKHPHIVAIHDRGLTAGHAYYVMDYVAGRSIDAYVAGADLSIEDILGLFAKVCDAVNVAHLRGVIHRDLKPGNIRVDEAGEPRILDFGLAKLVQDAAEASSARGMTLTGQFVGSLPWSSPEQAGGRSELIDVRSDVYSLGIILYQLLTRRFPYPVIGKLNDVVRHITETSPARPSTVRRGLDHDIELILLKCLAKEPGRRYQSAGELVGDVRHYLAHEPVSATSPSAAYRMRKFVRRNRGPVIAGAVVAATLVAATVVSTAFAVRASRALAAEEMQRKLAEQRAAETQQLAEFQQAQLAGVDPDAMGARLRADLLDKARTAAERSKLPPEEADARIAELESLIEGIDFTGMALAALEGNFFDPALATIETQFADQPVVAARLLQSVASTLHELGLLKAALAPQEEALAIRREHLGDDHVDTLRSISEMGLLLRAQGKTTEAEPYYRETLAGYRRVLGDEDPEALRSLNNLAALLQAQGKFAEAEPLYREVLEQRRRILGDDHPDTLTSTASVGYLLTDQGRWDEAEPYYREALEKRRRVLGDDHPHTLFAINNMATLLQTQRRFVEAEALYQEALDKRRRILGDDHPDTLQSLNNLGNLLQAQGRNAEAEPYFREALEKRRRVLGEDHPHTLNSIAAFGAFLLYEGRLDEAEPLFIEALEKRRSILGDDNLDTLLSVNNLGMLREKQGRLVEAESYLREALDGIRRVHGDDGPYVFLMIMNLNSLLQDQGKHAEALELLSTAEPLARRKFTGPNAPRLARFLIDVGHARVAVGQFETAEADLIEAHEILSAADDPADWNATDALTELAELFEAWHTAEPDQGYDEKAAEWRAKLVKFIP